jgi:hypothetical protein
VNCAVEGCERTARTASAELCNAHYFRVYRTGETGPAEVGSRPCPRGCGRSVGASSTACWPCRRSDLHPNLPRVGEANPAWKGREIGYVAAHQRVTSQRGPASEQVCLCGRQAAHWSYTHKDPEPLLTPAGIAYSPEPEFYEALCVPCHKRFDLDRLAETGATVRQKGATR